MTTMRHVAALLALAAAVTIGALPVQADDYPARAVRIIVPFGAGGPTDVYARSIAEELRKSLQQTFIIENRPGAGTTIGTELVAKAAPDGYTLLMVSGTQVVNETLYNKKPYQLMRDLVPIAPLIDSDLVLVVHPSVPAKTVPEFLAYAKANAGAVKMASTGSGSSPHVTGELFKQMTGLQIEVVHYAGGGPGLKAMIEGQAQVMFEPMSASIGPVRSNKLRAIAVTTSGRSAALPEVPAVAETVPGYEASAVTGIGVPKGTPAEVVETLNKAMQAAFADPAMKSKLADTGGAPLPGSSADFARLMAAETEKWGKVVKAAGIKAE